MSIQKVERIEEVWKPIEGFDNYEISNQGDIRSRDRKSWHKGSKTYMKIKGKVMKQRWNKACKCYFLDLINNDGKRKTVYPHKEVAKAFCINVMPEELTMIIHLDNNPKNNNSSNLDWVSPSEHMAFQFKVGNKDNYKVWEVRKKKYKNGFKSSEKITKSQQGKSKPSTVKSEKKENNNNQASANNLVYA